MEKYRHGTWPQYELSKDRTHNYNLRDEVANRKVTKNENKTRENVVILTTEYHKCSTSVCHNIQRHMDIVKYCQLRYIIKKYCQLHV